MGVPLWPMATQELSICGSGKVSTDSERPSRQPLISVLDASNLESINEHDYSYSGPNSARKTSQTCFISFPCILLLTSPLTRLSSKS